MTLSDADWVAIALRLLGYVGTIAVAGSVLVRATLPAAASLDRTLRLQILLGTGLLFLVEPLRYVWFQLQISGGDLGLAFSPSMRWIGLTTPIGQASATRLLALAPLLLFGTRRQVLAIACALVIIGSYALEGHSHSHGNRLALASLLIFHLTVVHWWLGSLAPLRSAARHCSDEALTGMLITFGRLAIVAVGVLALAGTLLLGSLTGWAVDLSNTYQQVIAAKLVLFGAILGIAAINKLVWTPLLREQPDRARDGLRRSIAIEIAVAVCILCVTATAISFSPMDA